MIDGIEKRICRLSFEFQSPHVIERRSNGYTRRFITLIKSILHRITSRGQQKSGPKVLEYSSPSYLQCAVQQYSVHEGKSRRGEK